MYLISFNDFQVQCSSADEVRELCGTRGKSMSERWEKARRYAKRHDVTPSEAFKIISK
jgi:hypothetical protein